MRIEDSQTLATSDVREWISNLLNLQDRGDAVQFIENFEDRSLSRRGLCIHPTRRHLAITCWIVCRGFRLLRFTLMWEISV